MDAPTAIAIATVAGVGLTLIVLLVRGTFMLGIMSNNVTNLNARVDGIDAKMDRMADDMAALRDDMAALRSEMQQSNRTLAALATHGHDADGRIVFTIPQ